MPMRQRPGPTRAAWLVPLTLLLPDLTMIGYIGGSPTSVSIA
jgi:hypothetical protein